MSDTLALSISAIDALLPQTQCTRCGYTGCRPYAEALARGEAELNRCPPGGADTIARLAQLLHRPARPLDPECGVEAPATIAWIDAERCIGCARCLPPCPTDAIIGAQRLLHTVIDELCTGCELCLASCPVDCIHMRARTAEHGTAPGARENRERYQAHEQRLQQRVADQAALLAERKQLQPVVARESDPP